MKPYEGTPGGRFNVDTDYWVNSAGDRLPVKPYSNDSMWHGILPSPEWVYFGDNTMKRALYLIHHEHEGTIAEFWHRGTGRMTVFGFGRGPRAEGWQRLMAVPTHLTIGFAEDSTFPEASRIINSSYQALDISIGSPETIP